jgi:rhamnose utilization protein RhaD (predicted bifunctional aldolase and dehydrogenase)
MLGSHGLFTWGETAYESYVNTLEVVEKCAEFIEESVRKNGSVFGGKKIDGLAGQQRKEQAAKIAPVLRGLCSSERSMIGHFTDDPRVLEFINSNDLDRLAPMGTSCPDHFLRTKISPLILDLKPDEDLSNPKELITKLQPLFEAYRKMYAEYYNTCKHPNSPAIRDSNPVIILYPGVGLILFLQGQTNCARGCRILYQCDQCDARRRGDL